MTKEQEAPTTDPRPLLRTEVVEYHTSGEGREGRVLRIHPDWVTRVYWLLVVFVVALAVFLIAVPINEYTSGPAIVRVNGRDVLTAIAAGTVVSVNVQPGQPVKAGQLLVQLEKAQETAARNRINREIELQSRELLLDLGNGAARTALTRLHAELELAESALAAREIRAPHDGTVRDIRIRESQYLTPGQVVLSLLRADAGFSVIALLPGESRPKLHKGDELRLEIDGYPYSYQRLAIDSIGDEVVGPDEARRFLGPVVGDAVALTGPVVLVRADLSADTFKAEDGTFSYFEGMAGVAEARTQRETILFTLIPGLKAAFQETHD